MKSEELKGKRLAVFGANNVVEEVTAYARKRGIVLVSVGNAQWNIRHHLHRPEKWSNHPHQGNRRSETIALCL